GVDWAGKTGTTNDYKDAWFVATNPNVTFGTWIGYDSNESLEYCPGCSLSYSQRNMKLWAELMNVASDINHDLLAPKERFERPDGIVERSYCAISGMLPSKLCKQAGMIRKDLFNAKCVPTKVDDSLISKNGKLVFNPAFLKRHGYDQLDDLSMLFPRGIKGSWGRNSSSSKTSPDTKQEDNSSPPSEQKNSETSDEQNNNHQSGNNHNTDKKEKQEKKNNEQQSPKKQPKEKEQNKEQPKEEKTKKTEEKNKKKKKKKIRNKQKKKRPRKQRKKTKIMSETKKAKRKKKETKVSQTKIPKTKRRITGKKMKKSKKRNKKKNKKKIMAPKSRM